MEILQFPTAKTKREYINRDEAIARIKAALKRRSGKPWSVTGGKGTAWGWITIDVPPKARIWTAEPIPGMEHRLDLPWERRYVYRKLTAAEIAKGRRGGASPEDRQQLADLLGLALPVHHQGLSIPAGQDYYIEYVDRAEGRTPSVIGTPYWD